LEYYHASTLVHECGPTSAVYINTCMHSTNHRIDFILRYADSALNPKPAQSVWAEAHTQQFVNNLWYADDTALLTG
jgi:hypothetical protein